MWMTPMEATEDGWLPTLLDIEKWKDEDPERFGGYGWSALVVPGDCPQVATRMSQIGELFNERYARRMIGVETLEAWQVRLQNRFDCEVHVFERAYRLYAKYAEEMEDVIDGEHFERHSDNRAGGSDIQNGTGSTENSGTDTVTNGGTQKNHSDIKGRFGDTPDALVNASQDFANSVNTSESDNLRTDNLEEKTAHGKKTASTDNRTTEYGRTDDYNERYDRRLTGIATGRVADAIGRWRDLDCEMVDKFENLFLNIFWY